MLLTLAIVAAILWLPSPVDWIVVGLAVVLEVGETMLWYRWSRRRKAKVGVETFVGRRAIVVEPCLPDGQVKIDGERWRARCEQGARTGEDVVVREIDGLTLVVEPATAQR